MSNLNMQTKKNFILCPICYSKTRTRIRPDTRAENLIVFCPKCKQESIVDVDGNITTISKPSFIEWLKGKRYVTVDENSTTMSEEYAKEHAWELSRNCFIERCLRKLTESI